MREAALSMVEISLENAMIVTTRLADCGGDQLGVREKHPAGKCSRCAQVIHLASGVIAAINLCGW